MSKKKSMDKDSGTSSGANDNANGGLPLFYKKPAVLNFKRHENATVSKEPDYTFAAETNSVALNAGEFVEAAKSYPIVFTKEPHTPIAIVGLEASNYFVDKKGKWAEGAYIPAYVRKYPFIFTYDEKSDQFLLCVDEAAEQFSAQGKKNDLPLFAKEGQPSDTTKSVLEFLKHYQQHFVATKQFAEGLQAEGLLVPNTTQLTLFSGRKINLGGFLMIDEKKFNSLPDEKIMEFRKKGWLPLIYFALMSVTNWKRIGDMAAQNETRSH